MSAPHSFQRDEIIRKKRNKRLLKYGLLFLGFIVSIALLSYISHLKSLRVSTIELEGGVLVTQKDISAETLKLLSGSYLWLFPRDNSLIYPKTELEKKLREKFKRIDRISISSKNPTTIVVTITERQAKSLWCDTLPGKAEVRTIQTEDASTTEQVTIPPIGNRGTCYFMDDNGMIFTEAPQFSGDAYFKYYGLISSSSPIGSIYTASTTAFRTLADFVTRMQHIGIDPEYLVGAPNNEYTVFISGGGKIYFDVTEPLSKTGDNLEALLRAPVFATGTRSRMPIDYIDLRFGNKLFYKLRPTQ